MQSLVERTRDAASQGGHNETGAKASENDGGSKATLSLSEELQQLLAFLGARHGVAVVDEIVAPLASGPHCLTLCSPDFRLRFIRDQNHLSAEVGPNNSTQWYDLNLILEYLDGQRPLAGCFDRGGLQSTLDEGWNALSGLLGDNRLAARSDSLDRFTAMGAAERWAHLRNATLE